MPTKSRSRSKNRSPSRAAPVGVSARPYLLGLGVVLAFAGQGVLLNTVAGRADMGQRQLLAGLMLIAGALMFGFAAFRPALPPASLDLPDKPDKPVGRRWSDPRGGLVLSATLSLASILLFLQIGETPLVLGLWLAGVAVLFFSQFWRSKFVMPAGLRREWPYLIALIVVLVIALAARLYHLTTLPYNFDGDFGSFGLEARALITGTQPHILAFGWGPAPLMGELPAALTMKLFGDSIFGLRVSGVIAGLLSILGVYLLARDLFSPRMGVLAAALLAASYAHLAASREAHILDSVPLLIFSLYFLLVGLRFRRGWAIVASGIMTALCLIYFYARILFPILFVVFLFLLLLHRAALFRRGPWLLLWVFAFLVALGPMLVVLGQHLQDFVGHTEGVFILNPTVVRHMMGVYRVDNISAMLWEQARRTALMFHYYGDTGNNFAFRRPLLDSVTAPFFTLGFGLALFQWRRLGASLAVAWTILGVILGCFVEENPPSWSRLIILLPAAALLAALALNALYDFARDRLKTYAPRFRLAAPAALAILLLWIGVRNWNTYVEVEGSYANSVVRAARYMLDQPPTTRAYLVSASGWDAHMREFEFLIPGRIVANLTPEQVQAGVANIGSPTLILLSPDQSKLAELLPDLFPGGVLTTGPDNDPYMVAFYAYRLR
jgi:hypothetical protein